MSDTRYCYHCGTHHPAEEMRQVASKGHVRYRCIKSIEATKQAQSMRDAYGRSVTETNKSRDRSNAARLLNPNLIRTTSE